MMRATRWSFFCWSSAGRFLQRHLHPARAKSLLRQKKLSLASLARSSHRRGVGLFVRRCGSARHRSSVELFGDVARTSGGNRLALWIGARGHWQCFPLDLRLSQPADPLSVATRWHSGRAPWLLAGAQSSRKQAQSRCCYAGDRCRLATRLDRKPYARRQTHDQHSADHAAHTCKHTRISLPFFRNRFPQLSLLGTPPNLEDHQLAPGDAFLPHGDNQQAVAVFIFGGVVDWRIQCGATRSLVTVSLVVLAALIPSARPDDRPKKTRVHMRGSEKKRKG